jgi:hypothetical protein
VPPFFGNSIYEATIPFSVTSIMSQCGYLTFENKYCNMGKILVIQRWPNEDICHTTVRIA